MVSEVSKAVMILTDAAGCGKSPKVAPAAGIAQPVVNSTYGYEKEIQEEAVEIEESRDEEGCAEEKAH